MKAKQPGKLQTRGKALLLERQDLKEYNKSLEDRLGLLRKQVLQVEKSEMDVALVESLKESNEYLK
jgi:hypothetical protein